MAQTVNFRWKEDPFIHNGLVEIPDLESIPKSEWEPFQQASNWSEVSDELPEYKPACLPELCAEFLAFDSHDEPLPELTASGESTSVSENEDTELDTTDLQAENDTVDDVWSWKDVATLATENKLVSWDSFLKPERELGRSSYLSEAGSVCLDAALAAHAARRHTELPNVAARQDDFLRSLFELGVGRSSLLYHYDQGLAGFIKATEDFQVAGISWCAQEGLVREVLEVGNLMRKLQDAIAKPNLHSLPIALESAISTILFAIERALQISRSEITSPIQLENFLRRPNILLHSLERMLKILAPYHGDREAIVRLTLEAESLIETHPWQSKLLHEILARVSAHWISKIETEVGLRPGHRLPEEWMPLVAGIERVQQTEQDNNEDMLLTDVEELVVESTRCRRILQDEQMDHPMLNCSNDASPHLVWQISWEAIAQIQSRANELEQSLKRAVMGYSRGATAKRVSSATEEAEYLVPPEAEADVVIDLDSPQVLGRRLGDGTPLHESKLCRCATRALISTSITGPSDALDQFDICPPLSHSLSLSLVPLLRTQSRLLLFSTLHLLFKTRSLRLHLTLQHRFHLFADSHFASRLSQALFDPDQHSGRGRRTAEGATGLRLQARDTWPPASSELRLALMGILSESYHTRSRSGKDSSHDDDDDDDDLPGNLSLAIRDLSPEKLEKCRDANSIEALDFLRLQYKPPPALQSIITASSLRKYDRIFKYMLRLRRIQAVGQTMLRDVASRNSQVDGRTQRLKLDIQHFISALAAYSSNDVIGVEWARFQDRLREMEDAIDAGDYEGTLAQAGSLSGIERLHEEVLDRIIRGLFLDRKQAQVREVIEGIFGWVLKFAGTGRGSGVAKGATPEVKKTLHIEFKQQVGRVVNYLRSQENVSSSFSVGSRQGEWQGEGELQQLLLLKLDLYRCHYSPQQPRKPTLAPRASRSSRPVTDW